MSIADNIKKLRESHGMSQAEFGEIAGVTYQAVSAWESGIKEPRMGAIQRIADYFGLKKSNIIEEGGLDDGFIAGIMPYKPNHKIPILGNISAGLPLYAEQHIVGYTTTDLNGGAEYFALRVTGDSMNAARINDGDTLIVRRQEIVENGEIAVVMVDGENATVKRFRKDGYLVTLYPQSNNPVHEPQVYDLRKTEVKVLGKVVRIQINIDI